MNADGDRHSPLSGYYMHIEPGGMSAVSCGIYITEEKAASLGAIGDLCREDRVLKRVPRGFRADSPAAEYLKLNHFYVWRLLPDSLVTGPDYISEALRLYELMKPLNDFLNRAIRP